MTISDTRNHPVQYSVMCSLLKVKSKLNLIISATRTSLCGFMFSLNMIYFTRNAHSSLAIKSVWDMLKTSYIARTISIACFIYMLTKVNSQTKIHFM